MPVITIELSQSYDEEFRRQLSKRLTNTTRMLTGSPFSGIRFIDRFTVRNGKLVDQQVWNDLAEAYPQP